MAKIGETRVVQKGDSAWKVAARNLKEAGKTAKNADIVAEMKRLAALNGCESVNDFNKKFFSFVGKEFNIGAGEQAAAPAKKPVKNTPAQKPKGQAPVKKGSAQTPAPAVQDKDSTAVRGGAVEQPDTTRVKKPDDKSQVVKTPEEAHAERINGMASDEQRIIEHNKDHYKGQYYGIVDKKSAQLKIYDKQGNVVRTFEVGVGKTKGDGIGQNYLDAHDKTKDAWKAEQHRLTTAGEFTLDEKSGTDDSYMVDGSPKIMDLKGDNRGVRGGQMAIHMIPKHRPERKAMFGDGRLDNNRMSYGCVNLRQDDYDAMHALLGEGDKIYILPEEKGNKLQLQRQKDGSYKFEQDYHKEDPRSMSKEQASRVNYDKRPDRNPVEIAKREAAEKAEKERLLAEQKRAEMPWYDPRKWIS